MGIRKDTRYFFVSNKDFNMYKTFLAVPTTKEPSPFVTFLKIWFGLEEPLFINVSGFGIHEIRPSKMEYSTSMESTPNYDTNEIIYGLSQALQLTVTCSEDNIDTMSNSMGVNFKGETLHNVDKQLVALYLAKMSQLKSSMVDLSNMENFLVKEDPQSFLLAEVRLSETRDIPKAEETFRVLQKKLNIDSKYSILNCGNSLIFLSYPSNVPVGKFRYEHNADIEYLFTTTDELDSKEFLLSLGVDKKEWCNAIKNQFTHEKHPEFIVRTIFNIFSCTTC